MTTDMAMEKILGLISKHPGLNTAEIASALSIRRQDRQHAHRFLVASGRIVGTLGTDRKTIEWRPREPRRPEPVLEPRQEPISEAGTLSAPEAPFQPPAADVAAKSKSPFDMSAQEWLAAFGDPDDLLIGGPS